MKEFFRNLNKRRHYRECARLCEIVAHTRKNSHLLGAELNAIACRNEILKNIGEK